MSDVWRGQQVHVCIRGEREGSSEGWGAERKEGGGVSEGSVEGKMGKLHTPVVFILPGRIIA